ncbi:hypothetical protein BC936DRAFT_149317, partial [Jimgerdemannia flammicorona]
VFCISSLGEQSACKIDVTDVAWETEEGGFRRPSKKLTLHPENQCRILPEPRVYFDEELDAITA